MNGTDDWIVLGTHPASDYITHNVLAVPAVVKPPSQDGTSIVEVTWKVHKETYMVHLNLTSYVRRMIWVILSTISMPGYNHCHPRVEAAEVAPGVWEQNITPPDFGQ